MIKFKTITMKNFLSVGDNPLTIIIDKSPTTIISGQNGVGKTATVLDSISFALFGKSFRDIKKAAMINSVNQRDSVVELIFAKGGNEYKIIRGQKPHRLEVFVNNKIMNETAALSDMQKYIENEILGFDLSAFSRVVLMSTMNYVPFLNLSAYERRNFVETMLNLSVFTEMNKQHKANISKLKDRANFIDTEIDKTEIFIKEKSEFLKYIQNSLTQEITTNKQQLTGLLKDIENLSKDLTKIEEDIKLFEVDSLNKDLIKLKNELNDVKSEETIIKHTLKENKNNIKFLETHDVCNHCKQDITDDYKQSMISDYTKNTETFAKSLEKIIKKENKISEKYDNQYSEIEKINNEKNKILSEKNTKSVLRKRLLQDSKNLVSKIDDLKSTSGTNTDDIIKDIGVLEDKLKNLKSEFVDIKQQAFASNIISELLKDTGIKSDIIKQYIPLLVAFTNQYLEKMNIALKFDMDENFSETITTRFANEFTYNNLSAGERARLDFSLQMAWREIARIKGSIDTNLLVLDEMLDANLDEAGTTAALEIINELSISHNVNVFIVSHKSNLEEYVRSVLKLEKVNGFTKIV